jgi:hypothetical protein
MLTAPTMAGQCAFVPAEEVFKNRDSTSFKMEYLHSIDAATSELKKQLEFQFECLDGSNHALGE